MYPKNEITLVIYCQYAVGLQWYNFIKPLNTKIFVSNVLCLNFKFKQFLQFFKTVRKLHKYDFHT